MSDQIDVGDLVELKGSCCMAAEQLRGQYGVTAGYSPQGVTCPCCRTTTLGDVFRVPDFLPSTFRPDTRYGWWPAAWLRKIPPFSELADEKTDNRIPELVLK